MMMSAPASPVKDFAFWVTVTVKTPTVVVTVMVPCRCPPVLFPVENQIVPDAVPVRTGTVGPCSGLDLSPSQSVLLLLADQEQFVPEVVTETLPDPFVGSVVTFGWTLMLVQVGVGVVGAADCDNVTV